MPPGTAGRGVRRRPAVHGLFQPLPGWVWAITFVMTLAGLMTQYPLLTAACVLTLPICWSLLWFKGEPPILFACCAMQWLQVTAAVFYSDLYNVTMESVLEAPEVERATWLCLGGVLCLALGMRTMLTSWTRGGDVARVLEAEASQMDLTRCFQIWLVAWVLGTMAEAVGWYVTAFHQFLVPVSNVKWVFFFIFCYQAILQNQRYGTMILLMTVEFVGGFMGMFSNFKEGLIMFLIVAVTVRRALNIRLQLAGLIVIVVGVFTSIFWSAVKHDYRQFVTVTGQRGMTERVFQRLDWLEDKLSQMDAKMFDAGMRALVARVQYVSLIGLTLNHVPRFEPHSKGELWLGAVKHVMMPRFIFRNKAVLDDSDRARRFTGLNLSGRDSYTSIGIGYMAESYADFGPFGMFVPVYLLGVFLGRVYQVASLNRNSAMLGVGIGTALTFSYIGCFATSNSKILGSMVTLCLAYWALNRTFGAQVVDWLKGNHWTRLPDNPPPRRG